MPAIKENGGYIVEFNRPITEEDHKAADENYRVVAQNQKDYINKIADKLEAGEQLSRHEIGFGVAVLRGAAKGMSLVRKRPAGRPAKLPGELAVLVGFEILEGKSKNKAVAIYAEKYGVSDTSVKEELKKQNFNAVMKNMKTWVRK